MPGLTVNSQQDDARAEEGKRMRRDGLDDLFEYGLDPTGRVDGRPGSLQMTSWRPAQSKMVVPRAQALSCPITLSSHCRSMRISGGAHEDQMLST